MKDTFYEGQKVWILPFEEVAGSNANVCHGILKKEWERNRRECPVTIDRLICTTIADMKEIPFYWPLYALSSFDPDEGIVSGVAVGDLL